MTTPKDSPDSAAKIPEYCTQVNLFKALNPIIDQLLNLCRYIPDIIIDIEPFNAAKNDPEIKPEQLINIGIIIIKNLEITLARYNSRNDISTNSVIFRLCLIMHSTEESTSTLSLLINKLRHILDQPSIPKGRITSYNNLNRELLPVILKPKYPGEIIPNTTEFLKPDFYLN